MKKWEYHLIQIYLFVQVSAIYSNLAKTNLPCHFFESVNITSGSFQYENGSISHNVLIFDNGTYGYTDKIYLNDYTIQSVEEHLRGCVCGLKTLKPCLPFCCPENFIKKGKSSICEPFKHEPILNSSNTRNSRKIDILNNFKIIQGRECDDFEQNSAWELQEVYLIQI